MASTLAVDKLETVNETHIDLSAGVSGTIPLNGSFVSTQKASFKAPGAIIQTEGSTHSSRYTFDPDGTWTEIGANASYPFRVTITPTSLTNKLLMNIHIFANDDGTNDISNYKIMDVTGDSIVTPKGDGASNRFEGHFAMRGKYDANDPSMIHFMMLADISRTTATTYTVYGRNGDGGAPLYINYSSSDNSSWGYTGVSSFIIQEIQQ